MDTQYSRTTIVLPESLLYAIKKKALEEKRTIKDIIIEELSNCLSVPLQDQETEKLEVLARNFVSAGKWNKNHPYWKNKQGVQKWFHKLRDEWK